MYFVTLILALIFCAAFLSWSVSKKDPVPLFFACIILTSIGVLLWVEGLTTEKVISSTENTTVIDENHSTITKDFQFQKITTSTDLGFWAISLAMIVLPMFVWFRIAKQLGK